MNGAASATFGISAIATYEPPCILGNDWFRDTIVRKFVQHTGTEARPVSSHDEVTMAIRAIENLQTEVGCNLQNCAAVVFASPSFIPVTVARKYFGDERAREESVQRAAQRLARHLRMTSCTVVGTNWFCAGYAKAMSILLRRMLPSLNLRQDQFALVVTAGRISRITDFECKQTGPLFGDIATATLVARGDSRQHPPHFRVLVAEAEKQRATGIFFKFHSRDNVLSPTQQGGRMRDPRRLVFSLDGMGIADAAPRAMSSALAKSLGSAGLRPEDVNSVVPHQAGTAIVRLTAMKMEEIGIVAETSNGITARHGNLSSSSIPFALKQLWSGLQGIIACPTAAVGDPGEAQIAQGCVLLQSTPNHARRALAA